MKILAKLGGSIQGCNDGSVYILAGETYPIETVGALVPMISSYRALDGAARPSYKIHRYFQPIFYTGT
jgi:hypothetical protein